MKCGLALLKALLMVGGLACSSGPPQYPTSLAPNSKPRRPPGISLDRPFATPRVDAHDERTAVLVPPLDVTSARRVVDSFLLAIQTEDVGALSRTLSQSAVQQVGMGREFRSAREYWQRRLTRLDYKALSEVPLYRPQDVHIRRSKDTRASRDAGTSRLAEEDGSLTAPSGDLMLTLPLLTTHVGSTRLFGPELTFLLTEEKGEVVIARIMEDFQLL